MFGKAVLRGPPRGGKKKRYVIEALIKNRLERCSQGIWFVSLWSEARSKAYHVTSHSMESSIHQVNAKWALALAREGRFRDAMRSLGSHGTSEGVQQGDPLGPLLFSLVIMELMGDL